LIISAPQFAEENAWTASIIDFQKTKKLKGKGKHFFFLILGQAA
jgi:hypothetical protein